MSGDVGCDGDARFAQGSGVGEIVGNIVATVAPLIEKNPKVAASGIDVAEVGGIISDVRRGGNSM